MGRGRANCFPVPTGDGRFRSTAASVREHIDLAELADRYPLSGGPIRNIAVRATFLAAGNDEPLSHHHFQRALELEYAERGKLTASGRLE